MTALLSPLWGRLSDRFGRKIMVERSLDLLRHHMVVFAYVTKPWHVFAMRALQGLFAGYGALGLAMAAESAPPGRMASAIGMVQTAQRLGPALGPVIGGVLAQLVGPAQRVLRRRRSFYVDRLRAGDLHVSRADAGGRDEAPPRVTRRSRGDSARHVQERARVRAFRAADGRDLRDAVRRQEPRPDSAALLAELGVTPDRMPIVAGILFSVLAATAAVGHHLTGRSCGRIRRARSSRRRRAVAGVAIAGCSCGSRAIGVLIAAIALFGFAVGVGMTAAYATAGGIIPHKRRARPASDS